MKPQPTAFRLLILSILIALGHAGLHAQITSTGHIQAIPTAYTDGSLNDTIYAYCEGTLGRLGANYPGAGANWKYNWFRYDYTNNTFGTVPFQSDTGSFSVASNLVSGGYQVSISNGAGLIQDCYIAWVFVDTIQAEINPQAASCDSVRTYNSNININDFTYFNPPPEQFIIDANTYIEVEFQAVHTYVSDLAYYLVGPPSCGSPTIQLGDELCCCNSGNNVASLIFNSTSPTSYDICVLPVPVSAGPFGSFGAQGAGPTAINWPGIYGCNAVDGGWAVQIYDCVGADVGALTRARITFSKPPGVSTSCGPLNITYDSGPINSVINDNSCTPATASIFQVPINPLVTTPIILSNGLASIQWATNNPAVTIVNGNTPSPTFQGLDNAVFVDIYLTVTDSMGCTKSDTFVNEYIPPAPITVTAPSSVCVSFGLVNLISSLPGGTWLGTGIVDPVNGIFDPAVSGQGTFTLTYDPVSICDTNHVFDITVGPNLNSSWTAPDTLCNPSISYNLNDYIDPGSEPGGIWTGPGVSNDSIFNPTTFGSYSLQYRVAFNDSLCADSTTNTIIVAPTLRVASIGSIDVSCFGGSDGAVFAQGVGGDGGPYIYDWNDPGNQMTDTAFGLAVGTYTVNISDSGGCAVSDSVTVSQPTILSLVTDGDSVLCNGGSSGKTWVTSTGGTPGYTVLWNDPLGQVTDTAFNLSAGTYSVTVTDANGCLDSSTVSIYEPAANQALTIGYDVSCFGGSDGSAVTEKTGGVGPYTYLWNDPNAQTSDSAINLSAGLYEVTITDNNGCTATDTISLTEPTDIQLSASSIPTSCFGGSNGKAIVSASGGVGPYTYLWNDPSFQTTDTATGLSARFYWVLVTDSHGCVDSISTQVMEPVEIQTLMSSTQTSCPNSAGGSASVTIQSGGVGPFSYLWDDPTAQTTSTAINLTARLYTVTVTDDSGCSVSDTVSVTAPNALVISTSKTDILCQGDANGTATVTISGGTAPFSIQWDDPLFQTTTTAVNLDSGRVIVEVQDDSGCFLFDTLFILEPAKLEMTLQSFDASCSYLDDGIAISNPSGGTNPYSFQWNDPLLQTNDTASNLPTGTWTVIVTDANLCSDTGGVSIGSPPAINVLQLFSVDPLCNGDNTGRASVIANGGTPGYTYLWSDALGQTTSGAVNLSAGPYTVTITDAQGCELDTSLVLTDPPAILPFVVGVTQPSCNGFADGSFTVAPTNGTAPFRYILNNLPQTSPTFTGIAAGTYQVIVADVNNCFDTVDVTVTDPPLLSVSSIVTDVSCFGYDDGEITVSVTGGTAPYQYRNQFNNYQSSNVLNGLGPNFYHITVRDTNGCLGFDSNLVVTEPTAFSMTVDVDSLSCQGSGDGRITVNVFGGTPPLNSFGISDDGIVFQNQSSNVFTGLDAGTYIVTALDGNNCPFSIADIPVYEPAFSIFSDTVIPTSCYGPEHLDGAIFVNGIGDNPPFDFSLNGGPFISTNVFRELGAGPYQVVGRDQKGCTDTFTITVPQPDPIVITIVPPLDSIQLGESVQLVSSVFNSNGPLQYEWTPTQGLNCADCPDPVVSIFETTIYELVVTDLDKPNRAVPCTGTGIAEIIVLPARPTFVPNAFTPNGDGNNDFLRVYGEDIGQIELYIFNRWGEKVYQSFNQADGWDGTYKNELLPPGVYTYSLLVTYLDGTTDRLKGTVTLIR